MTVVVRRVGLPSIMFSDDDDDDDNDDNDDGDDDDNHPR